MTIKKLFKKHANYTNLAEGDFDYMMDEEDFTNAVNELLKFHPRYLKTNGAIVPLANGRPIKRIESILNNN